MKNSLLELIKQSPSIKQLSERLGSFTDEQKQLYISALPGSTKSLLISLLARREKQIVVLLPSIQIVNETKVELDIMELGDRLVAIDQISADTIQEKITTLANKSESVLLATYEILKLKLPKKTDLASNTTIIEVGSELSYDDIVEYLSLLSYQRDKFVEHPGDFAIRGSIIDFWSYSEKSPARLEFDGDFLESIRLFDPDSQRSAGRIERISLAAPIDNSDESTHSSTIFDYLNNPLIIASEMELTRIFEKKIPSDPATVELPDDIDEDLKKEIFEEETVNSNPTHDDLLQNDEELSIDTLYNQQARWLIEAEIGRDSRIEFSLHNSPVINANYEILFNNLVEYGKADYQIFITTENELQTKRLYELINEYSDETRELLDSGKVKFTVLPIKKGFVAKDDKLLVFTDYGIFNKPYRTKISAKQKRKKSRVKDFVSIKKGDYVVHENFGIGQYAGLETIKIGITEQESIKILYAEGGVVYVNLNYLSLVKKFSSQDNAQPRLSVLGSNEWKNTKTKVKKKIQEAARELIKLYAKRKASDGFAFSGDTIWQKELEASFFYEDTPDQAKVTEEVKEDMQGNNPMDRLVCGDVGFGKTEIAVRAAFKAVNDGKQVVVLVPTTILAEQHFGTFKERLAQFPVKVAALSRFSTKAQQTDTIKKLSEGKVDIVIGTHRLLSKDVELKDLGLLIIDEEHKFGVMAKEKLRALRANVDTLTLTATPIPRTLNLSLLGARDLSLITTPPPNRQPIYTKVEVFDIAKIREWINSELERDGQVYFVHDRVQSIDKISAYLKRHIPDLKVAVAHGQMKPAQLEKVIHEFMNKKYHMLIATKIIESGLDIPNVNTIIINRADRFGLAELHQLRGRVGRSNRQAHAFLLVPSLNTITKKAVKRLQAIEEYTDLGEGFNLSMRDLEIRGAGNLLGTEQSGAIDSVGFEMYIKLVDEAVEELKRSEFKTEFADLPKMIERSEPTIDTYFEIGIPQDYMPDQADRLSFYTAMFTMLNIDEITEIVAEMEDRYGKLPTNLQRLVSAAILRYYSSIALLERIVILKDKVTILLPKATREEFYEEKFPPLMQYIMVNHSRNIRFKQNKDVMKLEILNKFSSPEETLKYIIDFVKKLDRITTEK